MVRSINDIYACMIHFIVLWCLPVSHVAIFSYCPIVVKTYNITVVIHKQDVLIVLYLYWYVCQGASLPDSSLCAETLLLTAD